MPDKSRLDDPDEPFASIDGLVHQLCEGAASWNEELAGRTPERLHRVNNMWEKASGGWTVDMVGSLDSTDPPERLRDRIETLRRDAFINWLESEPYDGALDDADELRCPDPHRMANLYAFAAEKLGKTKAEVDADVLRSYWPVLNDLDDREKEDFYEAEREWLNESYWLTIEAVYYLPDDTDSRWPEPVVHIALRFSDDEYNRRSEVVGGFTVTVDAFKSEMVELLADRIRDVFSAL